MEGYKGQLQVHLTAPKPSNKRAIQREGIVIWVEGTKGMTKGQGRRTLLFGREDEDGKERWNDSHGTTVELGMGLEGGRHV